ncbi:hypothetical protein ACLI2N_17100, partial [Enterococcus faecalis]
FTTALLLKLLTILAVVEAFERTFIPVVVCRFLLIACSAELLDELELLLLDPPVDGLLVLLASLT